MSLLPDPNCLVLDIVRAEYDNVILEARTTAVAASCPNCQHSSTRIHSRYQRKLTDLPWQGRPVHCLLTVRKFRCQNPECSRKVFVERLPTVADKHAQKTVRLSQVLRQFTWLTGGEVSAKIAQLLGIFASPDALLDRLKRSAKVAIGSPRVLGVDDFAFRRGHVYGTILVDLERRCPIDLLPDRESKTLEDWLRVHPGVEVLSRDRSTPYTDAANKAIPQAIQVADRWHLVKNLSEAVTRFLEQHRAELRKAAPCLVSSDEELPVIWPPTKGAATEEHSARQRDKRHNRYRIVMALYERGMSQRKIAKTLGLSRGTVKRFVNAGEFPEIARRAAQPTSLDPYKAYLQRRWREGCHNGSQLFREIKEQGFSGTCSWVNRYMTGLRKGVASLPRPLVKTPSTRSVATLFMRSVDTLQENERLFLTQLSQDNVSIQTVYDLTQRFLTMVRSRNKALLPAWLADVRDSKVSGLVGFGKGLLQDLSAVEAGLSLDWSNGPVEGQVNRLKLVKRSMYGRASFALLKARVLPLTPS